ncbi:retrotransposon protein, putative, ty1-copia subclass [Tanacetum coccineum]
MRILVRPFFWVTIGNRMSVLVMHDLWYSISPLIDHITPRDAYNKGFNNHAKVAQFMHNNEWRWPVSWLAKIPNLSLIPAPNINVNNDDLVRWKDLNGVLLEFLVSHVWEAIRPRGNEVECLKTQDKLQQWDVGNNIDLSLLRCPFCETQSDTHAHLFFECTFSTKVWTLVCHLAAMEMVPPTLQDIISHLRVMTNQKSAECIIGKLIIAASSYYVWLERNNRLFKKLKCTPEDIKDVIMVTVRLKLLTLKFKNSGNVASLIDRWKMPRSFALYDS